MTIPNPLIIMLAAIAELPGLPTFLLFITAKVTIMATLSNIHSIGENQQRITGKKSQIFTWFETLTTLLNQGIITKLKSSLIFCHPQLELMEPLHKYPELAVD